MEYAIETKNLLKVYGEGRTQVEAVKDISLAVRPGELFAIMGPSGSGKTTLLMILGLVTVPTEGSVILEGENIHNGRWQDLQRLRREKVGFIFQFANLIPFLTAKENVLLPMELIGIAGRQAEARTNELLDYFEVADRADLLPDQLSGGERQRVAVARALANSPAIILADEPTASLDTERGLAVMRLLRKVSNEQGTTILVVTHDQRMITEVDRVIHLMDGRIVETNGSEAKG
ncbi:MAG: ABC transporter ATP-binding protein [Acidobacteria bacterium]|nr:MAG: ABC transporter ATP-binding protein [Acidobacteriota bacterium]